MSKPAKPPRCKHCGTTMQRGEWASCVTTIKLPFGFKLELLRYGKTNFECPNECNIP